MKICTAVYEGTCLHKVGRRRPCARKHKVAVISYTLSVESCPKVYIYIYICITISFFTCICGVRNGRGSGGWENG